MVAGSPAVTAGTVNTPGGAPTTGEGGASNGVSGSPNSTAGAATGGNGTAVGSGGSNGGSGGSGTGGRAAAAAGSGNSNGGAPVVSALCPANALICEDFESGTIDAWTKASWQQATLAVDSRQAAHGTKSFSITTPAMGRGGFLERRGAPLFPLPNKAMWGRMMVFFESTSDGHTDFVRGAPAKGTPLYNVAEQHHEILLNYYNGSAADCWARPKPGKIVALSKWTCWEWNFDGNTNQMTFWIDGAVSRIVNMTGDGCLSNQATPWIAPDFAALDIGQYIAEPKAVPMQMWIDDIAVGNQSRIGCPM